MIKKYPTFCIMPFIGLNMHTDKHVSVCCRNKLDLRESPQLSMEQMWNSSTAKELRLAFIRGERHPSCSECWEVEDKGGQSYRHRIHPYEDRYGKNALNIVNPDTGEMPFQVKYIEFKISSLCNLACKMCWPTVSTTLNSLWTDDIKKIINKYSTLVPMGKGPEEAVDNFDQFLNDVRTMAPFLEKISLAGGEPLMEERFVEIFDALGSHKEHILVSVITNMSKLKHGRFDIIPQLKPFGAVGIVVSLDGTPIISEYVRTYSNASNVKYNFDQLRKHLPNAHVSINTAISALNVLDLADALDYYLCEFKPESISSSFVTNPHLQIEVLPSVLKAEAMGRIYKFMSEKLPTYEINEYLKKDIQEQCESAIIQLQRAEYNQPTQQWLDFVDFCTIFDKKCNSSILDTIPELKPYWPSSSELLT